MTHLLFLATRENQHRMAKPRVFRDINQPLKSLDNVGLISQCRFCRYLITDLCDLLAGDLQQYMERSGSVSVVTQILVALHYFAKGSFQRVDGDLHGVSQSSLSPVSYTHLTLPTNREV